MNIDTYTEVEVYAPNRRMYNIFAKSVDDEGDIEWVNVAWGTIEDCLEYAKMWNWKDDMFQILPTDCKISA